MTVLKVEITQHVEIKNRRGLHARAAALFVKYAEQYDSDIQVASGDHQVPGRSIMGLLLLSASVGSHIKITAVGHDAPQAVEALRNLVESKFFEDI